MDNIFYRVLLQDKIKIEPKYLSKDYRNYVLQKLKKQNEGVCTKHGYIRDNSIEVYKVAPGAVDMIGLNGYVVFDVHYYADVCNPLLGHTVKAKVVNVNKFGILAEVAPILEIIVAKNSVNILSEDGIDLESIKPGDIIQVEIMGKKFELNDKKISIVGRVVSQTKGTAVASPKQKPVMPKDDDDEELDKFDLEDETDESDDETEDEEDAESSSSEEEDVDIEAEIEEDDETQKGGTGFFESDEDDNEEDDYEFFSEQEDYPDSDASTEDDDE